MRDGHAEHSRLVRPPTNALEAFADIKRIWQRIENESWSELAEKRANCGLNERTNEIEMHRYVKINGLPFHSNA
jgi:hypothetical protein